MATRMCNGGLLSTQDALGTVLQKEKQKSLLRSSSSKQLLTTHKHHVQQTDYWLNQLMLQMLALRDAVGKGDAAAIKATLAQARERRIQWLTDWHRGREEGQSKVPVEKPSLLGSLIGTRLATKLQTPPGGGDPTSERRS